jgi:Ser/Thr protein kinase RdoA (MazF antagonist)
MVRSELAWLAALRQDAGLDVPEPVAALDGALLVEVDAPGLDGPRWCTLFRPVDGRFVAAGDLTPRHLGLVGAFMARLHTHAAGFVPPPGFVRPRWDWRWVLGESSVFGPGQGAGLVPAESRTVFAAAATRIAAAMAALDSSPAVYGLIHADLQQTNYLFRRGTVGAIDFEDCCWGYHLFDMAIPLFEIADRPDAAGLRAAFFAGYAAERPLPPDHTAGLALFTALRLAKRVNYLARAGDPALRAQAPGWVAYATRWLATWLDSP